jgi:hypothetical protein
MPLISIKVENTLMNFSQNFWKKLLLVIGLTGVATISSYAIMRPWGVQANLFEKNDTLTE